MSCLLCRSDGPFRRRFSKQGYSVCTCSGCGLTQLHPLPDPQYLSSLYSREYFEGPDSGSGYDDYRAQEIEYQLTFGEDLKRIARFVPRGRVLEVGCGYGYFLQRAALVGYDVYGVDISEMAVQVAQARFPGRIFHGSIEQVEELRKERFDVIFASHVIEHLSDPLAFVRCLNDLLSPDGLLVLVTPNIASLLARVSRSRWVSFKIPEHVAFYNPRTIQNLLQEAGLLTLAVDPAHQFYRLPFVMAQVRKLLRPFSVLIPRIENLDALKQRIVRISSGSLRAIATPAGSRLLERGR